MYNHHRGIFYRIGKIGKAFHLLDFSRSLNQTVLKTVRHQKNGCAFRKYAGVFGGGVLLGFVWLNGLKKASAQQQRLLNHGEIRSDLPEYTNQDVAAHTSPETRIWVSYKHGVYDITDYQTQHPGGGGRISQAAGKSLEPYWELYPVHKAESVLDVLEQYRIGNLDVAADDESISNTTLEASRKEAEDYRLTVSGIGVSKAICFSLCELKNKLPSSTVVYNGLCAKGNCSGLSDEEYEKNIKSRPGDVTWTGVKMVDMIKYLGINVSAGSCGIKYAIFCSQDDEGDGKPYTVTLPIERVTDPKSDILVAYEMNGKELTKAEGYPVRLIVPGSGRGYSVKRLKHIIFTDSL